MFLVNVKPRSLKSKFSSLALLSVLLIIGGCASYPGDESDNGQLAKVENRTVSDGEVLPLPDSPSIRTRSMSSDAPSSSVVRKLMSTAQQQREAGNLDAAANSLERALRLEPRNAKLWSRLANIRFSQQLWQKSIQLANKSNTLASSSRGLRRQNWYLIANAYSAAGDEESAQEYREKLRR